MRARTGELQYASTGQSRLFPKYYTSFPHSRYVAARIRTWTNEGQDQLRNLFARIGVPFKECEQPFFSWDEGQRDYVSNEMLEKGPIYGLNDLTIPSFVFRRGYQRPVRCCLSGGNLPLFDSCLKLSNFLPPTSSVKCSGLRRRYGLRGGCLSGAARGAR